MAAEASTTPKNWSRPFRPFLPTSADADSRRASFLPTRAWIEAPRAGRGIPMNADEQAIRDLVGLWHRATAAGEVDTVLGLMAEDAVFLVAGQPAMNGRGSFERGLRRLLAHHRIESTGEVQEVDV